jgi:hypothetical protein
MEIDAQLQRAGDLVADRADVQLYVYGRRSELSPVFPNAAAPRHQPF